MATQSHILAYRQLGSGPSVVLLHGLPSASAYWLRVLPLLEQAHRVVALDLLGFGRSPKPADARYTLDEQAIAIEATLEAIDLPKPWILVGHSMGSLIATRIARRHPDWIRHLVLISLPAYDNVLQARRQIIRSGLSPKFMTEGGWARFATWAQHRYSEISQRAHLRFHPETEPQIARHGVRHTRQAYALALDEIIHQPFDRRDLLELKLPITILNGRKDALLRKLDHSWYEETDHIEVIKIPVGHQLPLVAPEAVAKVILATNS